MNFQLKLLILLIFGCWILITKVADRQVDTRQFYVQVAIFFYNLIMTVCCYILWAFYNSDKMFNLPWEPAVFCGGATSPYETLCFIHCYRLMDIAAWVHISSQWSSNRHAKYFVLLCDQLATRLTT